MTGPLPARIATLYPFQPRRLDVGGLSMSYVDEGTGEPLVCVHGNPTWSFMYRNIIARFSKSMRVVAPDHIGCGLSEKPTRANYEFTLERRLRDFSAFMDAVLPSTPVTLMVHDWGGMIGFAWAVRNPDRIARLIVTNTAAFPKPAAKPMPWQLRVIRASGPLADLLVCGFNAFARGTLSLACQRPVPGAVREGFLFPYDTWNNRVATLEFVRDIPLKPGDRGYDILIETSRGIDNLASKPMLVCWGLKDPVFDHHFLKEWRARFPQATTVEYPNAGHYLLEDEGPEVMAEMERFIASASGTPRPAHHPASAS